MRPRPLSLLGIFLGIATVLLGDRLAPGQRARVSTNYGSQLPRIPPHEPGEALSSFRLHPRFRLETVAAEPLVRSPVAMDFDENARLFVAEFPEYNQYVNPQFREHGCIRLLEDPHGDGHYVSSRVYVDHLDSPVAVACYDGGIFVGTPPDIWYFKDSRGDGNVDIRRRVYTGFGLDVSGEARLNSFRWGLDQRFHVSTSLAGGAVRRADQPTARPVSVRNELFVFDPRTLAFTVQSAGGQHGMCFDDEGRTFVCGNSDPIDLLMYDSRYLADNPFVAAPPAAVNIAPDGKFTRLFRISPNEPWRVLRTRLRSQGIVPGPDEGGRRSGFFTGASGVTVYRGDAYPAEFRNNVFVGEVANNLVYRARLEPRGVGLIARRADPHAEFLASADTWFRPVQFANGPDGCLYVIDMYREFIEAANSVPPDILKHLDVSSGVNRGRIYRIAPLGYKRRVTPRLGHLSTAELVKLLEHPDGWHRDTASRLLCQRRDPSAIVLLERMAISSPSPLGRLHALHLLAAFSALRPAIVMHALQDADTAVRTHAVLLAEPFAHEADIATRLGALTEDADPRVRYQLAFSLAFLPPTLREPALVRLAKRDGQDPWARFAVLVSVRDVAADLFGQLADAPFRLSPPGQAFLEAIATQIGASHQPDALRRFGQTVEHWPTAEEGFLRTLVRRLLERLPAGSGKNLRARIGPRVAVAFHDLLQDAERISSDSRRTPEARAAAVSVLALVPFADHRDLFAQLLQPREPEPVQKAVLEVVGRFSDSTATALVLDAWPTLSPGLRPTAVEALFSRPESLKAFLDAVERGSIRPGDIDPARIQLLQRSADPVVRKRAGHLFSSQRLTGRKEIVAAYQPALRRKGNVERGKAVFRKICSRCHRLQGVGEAVGPDLSSIRNRGLASVMLNILDPNLEVQPQYLSYMLVTRSGRLVTGLIAAETANSISIRRPDGSRETIPRADIEELRSTGLSYMPEGLEKQVDVQAMADLLTYLDSIR